MEMGFKTDGWMKVGSEGNIHSQYGSRRGVPQEPIATIIHTRIRTLSHSLAHSLIYIVIHARIPYHRY